MAPALVMYHWALVAMKLDGANLGKRSSIDLNVLLEGV